jgi:hypothetical protein
MTPKHLYERTAALQQAAELGTRSLRSPPLTALTVVAAVCMQTWGWKGPLER